MMNVLLRVTATKVYAQKPMVLLPAPVMPATDVTPQPQRVALTVFLPEGTPLEGTHRGVTIDLIKRTVCAAYKISKKEIESETHTGQLVLPRQIAMYLCHTLLKRTERGAYPVIGRHFGDRDHTTVLSGVRKITRLIKTDVVLAAKVEELAAIVREDAAKPILKIDVNAPGRI